MTEIVFSPIYRLESLTFLKHFEEGTKVEFKPRSVLTSKRSLYFLSSPLGKKRVSH